MCGIGNHHGNSGTPEMTIEILPDGRVKVDTGDLSGAQHMSAEKFLRFLEEQLSDEPMTKTKKVKGLVAVRASERATLKAKG